MLKDRRVTIGVLCSAFAVAALASTPVDAIHDQPECKTGVEVAGVDVSGLAVAGVDIPGAAVAGLAMNCPDMFAWMLFVEINNKAANQFPVNGKTTNDAVWEQWADDPLNFPTNPDPNNPPKWPADGNIPKSLQRTTHQPVTAGSEAVFVTCAPTKQQPQCEEVHRNKPAFDYIIKNNLWYTQGLATAFASELEIDFPIDSIEVKSNWVRIDETDKSMYHWNYDADGNLNGLVAMHLSSKALPNWLWATFEWVNNKGRCDYIGCSDSFGQTPHHEPSNTDKTGKLYQSKLTEELKALFKQGGLTGAWGDEWKNYRLKGTMTEFTDSTGIPNLLGNSITEDGFVTTASCMTCHGRAAVNSKGKDSFPVAGFKTTLPLEGLEVQGIQSYNGVPDPNWYFKFTYNPSTGVSAAELLNLQMDFVWAIPFKAKPAAE